VHAADRGVCNRLACARWALTYRPIDKREQYVDFATHCLQLAKVTADHQSRIVLREMAAEWLKLAEVAG
jgi:hypothetical protein